MVVIVIIGIIAAIAVPKFVGAISNARTESDKANIKMLQSAVERAYAQTGSYPASLNELVSKDFVKKIPDDPRGGNYSYSSGIVSCPHGLSGNDY